MNYQVAEKLVMITKNPVKTFHRVTPGPNGDTYSHFQLYPESVMGKSQNVLPFGEYSRPMVFANGIVAGKQQLLPINKGGRSRRRRGPCLKAEMNNDILFAGEMMVKTWKQYMESARPLGIPRDFPWDDGSGPGVAAADPDEGEEADDLELDDEDELWAVAV